MGGGRPALGAAGCARSWAALLRIHWALREAGCLEPATALPPRLTHSPAELGLLGRGTALGSKVHAMSWPPVTDRGTVSVESGTGDWVEFELPTWRRSIEKRMLSRTGIA